MNKKRKRGILRWRSEGRQLRALSPAPGARAPARSGKADFRGSPNKHYQAWAHNRHTLQVFLYAFTLTELLVSVALIAILTSLTLSTFSRVTERSKRARCSSNLRQLFVWYSIYLEDGSEFQPSRELQRCPTDKVAAQGSYTIASWRNGCMVFDRQPFHQGYNVAFPDGHVDFKRTKVFLIPAAP